jgi:23S rRNA (cytosine1962-C5)-methyltransferase
VGSLIELCHTLAMTSSISGYKLLDSGDGRKLEQFGDVIIDRPSSLSAWQRRQPLNVWEAAAATYAPPDSWQHLSTRTNLWTASIAGVSMELELLSNGQVGLFPEHAIYLSDIQQSIVSLAERNKRPVSILNLFAYTGLATSFCALLPQAQVTHVDLAKRAIEWAKRNAALNAIPSDRIRWIVDDALAFMAREQRKKNLYDIVIIDPPSFSRVSKNNTWTLDEKAPEIVQLVLSVLQPEAGVVYFTNHSSASTSDVARNIALDTFCDKDVSIAIRSLALEEEFSPRKLPAGSLIVLSHGMKV